MAETKSKFPNKLYLGCQNDALYIITKPPRPSMDHINPNHDHGPDIVARVFKGQDDLAKELVELWNAKGQ